MLRARLAWVTAASAALIMAAFALHGQSPEHEAPLARPRGLPPVPEPLRRRTDGALRVIVRNARFTTSLGARVRVPRTELRFDASTIGREPEPIRAALVRITGLEVVAPADTIVTPLNLFAEWPGPPVHVQRVIVDDAFLRGLAHPTQYEGRWLWRVNDLDLDVRDLRMDGEAGTESLRVVRTDFSGEVRGRPLGIRRMTGRAHRTESRFVADAQLSLGESQLAARGVAVPSGDFRVELDASPLAFAEVDAVWPDLPERGTATLAGSLELAAGTRTYTLERGHAAIGAGMVTAHGRVQTGDEGRVDDVVIDLQNVAAKDIGDWFEIEIPSKDPWSGRIAAEGGFRDGVAVDARLAAAGRLRRPGLDPRIALNGTLRVEPEASVDLTLSARDLRVEPIDQGEVILSGELRSNGPADSLSVTGVVTARRDSVVVPPSITNDRGDNGDVAANVVVARVAALLSLEGAGTVDAHVVADSIPLALVPLPSEVDSVSGTASGEVRVTGRLSDPEVLGELRLRDGGVRVPTAELAVSAISGPIRFTRAMVRIEHIRGRANGGPVELWGDVMLGEPDAVDLRLTAENVLVLDTDSGSFLGFASIVATGPLDEPVARGDARLLYSRREPVADTVTVAVASGSAVLASEGAVSAIVTADSLPLNAVPVSAEVEDVRGTMSGELRVSGTLERARLDGVAQVRDAGLRVLRTGTPIERVNGRFRIEDGVATAEDVRGRAGAGAVALEGSVRIHGQPRRLDLILSADSATLMDTDSATVVGSARLRAAGSLEQPRVDGNVTLLTGTVHEDNFKRSPPIDLESPPYADLAERVPWIERSRLRSRRNGDRHSPRRTQRKQSADSTSTGEAALRGRIAIEIRPGVKVIDEDSELYGTGRVIITADSTGFNASGLYHIEGGTYAQYGEVLRVVGGVFQFTGSGFDPRVTLRSELVYDDQPLTTGMGGWINALESFSPLESFAIGSTIAVSEEARRLSLLPESKSQLARLLLWGVEPEVITGLRTSPLWAPDDGGDFAGERAETQSVALLWAYLGNEFYDFVPPSHGHLDAGVVTIGSEYPARMVVGPTIGGVMLRGRVEARVAQPVVAGAMPGLRLRYRLGAWQLVGFAEPWFRVAVAEGGGQGFLVRRRAGIGVRWVKEY